MNNLHLLQKRIGEWAETTFPTHTDDGIIKHLRREVQELDEKRAAEEVADCLILLFTLADRNGWDVHTAVTAKMEINRARKWGQPDAEGISEHIREGA